MLSEAQALTILGRYAPPSEAPVLLAEHTVTRQVSGVQTALYDPYAAALAYLMHPDTLKARTQGSVSETYIDPAQVAAYLQQQSTALRESWPAPDVTSSGTAFDDLTITVVGWGQ